MVKTLTDNKNRTAPEIRHAFEKHGGNLGTQGCVAWMFDRKGTIQVDASKISEDDLMALALDAGALDLRRVDKVFEIVTAPEDLESVRRSLEARSVSVGRAEITMMPLSTVKVEGKEAQQVLRLMEELEEHDDVQAVYANFDIPDEIIDAVSAA